MVSYIVFSFIVMYSIALYCIIHPASRGMAAHTLVYFVCDRGEGWSKQLDRVSHSVFHSVFTIFPVKNTVISTFFAIKSVQNTRFCSVSMLNLWHPKTF